MLQDVFEAPSFYHRTRNVHVMRIRGSRIGGWCWRLGVCVHGYHEGWSENKKFGWVYFESYITMSHNWLAVCDIYHYYHHHRYRVPPHI